MPKSQIASQKAQAELSYNSCFDAALALDGVLFPWVGGDARTVTNACLWAGLKKSDGTSDES